VYLIVEFSTQTFKSHLKKTAVCICKSKLSIILDNQMTAGCMFLMNEFAMKQIKNYKIDLLILEC